MNGLTAAQVKTRFIAGMVVAILIGIIALIAINYMDAGDVNGLSGMHMVVYALLCLLALGPMLGGMFMDWKNRPKFSLSMGSFVKDVAWSFKCIILAYRGIVWALSRGDEA